MKKYVIAITGASAQPLGEKALKLLLNKGYEVHLILSRGAYELWQSECQIKVPAEPKNQEKFWRERIEVKVGKLVCYRWNDNSAIIASGSFQTDGMIIIPCTMGTIGRIASGISLNLIERCADVHLKEARPLIISPRESPFSYIHLKNMTNLSKAGAKIVPPIPAWYTNPQSIDEMIEFIVVRLFDILGENLSTIKRWKH